MQDIAGAHDASAAPFLKQWGNLLPELLAAVLCEDLPAVCRRDTTNAIVSVTNPRGGATPDNAAAFTSLLASDDFTSNNDAVQKSKRLENMPSTLAAFCGVLDTCGDFVTQVNTALILHAAARYGGLDTAVVARAFGSVKKEFVALVDAHDEQRAEDLRFNMNDFMTEYNISLGSRAR